ncbi:MAG: DUF3017 domain-containing protein [Bifidobacteriaceae bacterium]|nr:DUF3017 domain-containing protein [Bifidobacteriaceae bacterium]MCI1979351.1 DUF3017 domain-containing protein [Bifidobacteriaceae bacterium]
MTSADDSVEQSAVTSNAPHVEEEHHHPYVSEKSEGKPWFEWCIAALVVISAALALFKLTTVATMLLAATSLVAASVRLAMRDKSPWKVRSIFFDCFIGYAFGLGLIGTYISILLIS